MKDATPQQNAMGHLVAVRDMLDCLVSTLTEEGEVPPPEWALSISLLFIDATRVLTVLQRKFPAAARYAESRPLCGQETAPYQPALFELS